MNRGQCIHYNGIQLTDDGCCKAGVNYRRAFGEQFGIFLRMPCTVETPSHEKDAGGQYVKVWKPIDRRGQEVVPCSLFQLPTDEQIAEHDRARDAAIQRAMAGVRAASAWRVRPKPQQDRHEQVECPVCKGKLHLSQSSVNGHVHGVCETDGCVNFME